jgi:hypothetical protein
LINLPTRKYRDGCGASQSFVIRVEATDPSKQPAFACRLPLRLDLKHRKESAISREIRYFALPGALTPSNLCSSWHFMDNAKDLSSCSWNDGKSGNYLLINMPVCIIRAAELRLSRLPGSYDSTAHPGNCRCIVSSSTMRKEIGDHLRRVAIIRSRLFSRTNQLDDGQAEISTGSKRG